MMMIAKHIIVIIFIFDNDFGNNRVLLFRTWPQTCYNALNAIVLLSTLDHYDLQYLMVEDPEAWMSGGSMMIKTTEDVASYNMQGRLSITNLRVISRSNPLLTIINHH